MVFVKIKKNIRHVTNVREDTLPPFHIQFTRRMNFQNIFIVYFRFHQCKSLKSKLLNSCKGDCIQHCYYLLNCQRECSHSNKDQATRTVQPGIVKQPAVGWTGTTQTFSSLEYVRQVMNVSTVFPEASILLFLAAPSQQTVVLFVLFAAMEVKLNISLWWNHFTASVEAGKKCQ